MKQTAIIVGLVLVLTGCSNINKVLKSNDIEYKYRKASEYFDKKKYGFSQQVFESIFPFLKGRKEFEDAFYKFTYTYYYLEDYTNAENLFRQFSEVFPNSPRASEMDYMRAYTYYKQSPKPELEQTNTLKTIGMMKQFISTHPGSDKIKEANEIIALCRVKLETKDFKNAELYYNMGQFKAAAVSFTNLMQAYPESEKADQYKLMIIKAYYQYATLSVTEKKEERFEQVITECNDFIDKYPESAKLTDVQRYLELSKNNINSVKNEQVKKTTGS
jgi:outer membrane protein assembly factor BamD